MLAACRPGYPPRLAPCQQSGPALSTTRAASILAGERHAGRDWRPLLELATTRPMATVRASDTLPSRRPLLIVGRQGQLATDLVETGARLGTQLVALGRPELDLADLASIERAAA